LIYSDVVKTEMEIYIVIFYILILQASSIS